MWCLSPTDENLGYKNCIVPLAQQFIHTHVTHSQDIAIQSMLRDYLEPEMTSEMTPETVYLQAQAALCLRCYVSGAIVNACRNIAHLFSSHDSFTYRDLLPFVLDDDGKTLVVFDRDRKQQLRVTRDGPPQPMTYQFFSMEVLRTFQADRPGLPARLSLDNWAMLLTKQNVEVKRFLSDCGFQHLSDWALLNRVRGHQLDQLSERDRQLVEVFHGVYRRDRRNQQIGSRRCSDPSSEQLQEMITILQTKTAVIDHPHELLQSLKRVALQLRQYDIWAYRVPLEIPDAETGCDNIRSDLPSCEIDAADLDRQELLLFFQQQLHLALTAAIARAVRDRITTLECSKKYAALAGQFIPGLQLYYGWDASSEGLSLRDIAPLLGMSSWDQARRILNPGDLLARVRSLTLQRVLDRLLVEVQQKGLAKTPPDPDYLRTLAEQVEAIADEEIFQAAAAEMRAGQCRFFKSIYAQQLRLHLAANLAASNRLVAQGD
jgi:hypothetical protein